MNNVFVNFPLPPLSQNLSPSRLQQTSFVKYENVPSVERSKFRNDQALEIINNTFFNFEPWCEVAGEGEPGMDLWGRGRESRISEKGGIEKVKEQSKEGEIDKKERKFDEKM